MTKANTQSSKGDLEGRPLILKVGSWEHWLAGSNRVDLLPPARLRVGTLSSLESDFRIPFGSARCRSTVPVIPFWTHRTVACSNSHGFDRYPRVSFSSMFPTWIAPSDCSLPAPWVVHVPFGSCPLQVCSSLRICFPKVESDIAVTPYPLRM